MSYPSEPVDPGDYTRDGRNKVTNVVEEPIPMLIWCPKCGTKHVDPPGMDAHHTHACQNRSCGLVWKPSLARTHGVEFLPGCENKP